MEYDDERLLNFLSGLICGAAIGAGVALVLAPDSGKKTRKRLHRAAGDLKETATDRWDDTTAELLERLEEVLDGTKRRFS